MKYKVGDRVLIREWDDMVKEFGLDSDGNINIYPGFTKGMIDFCGTMREISSISCGTYRIKKDLYSFDFSDDMIERKVNEMTKADLKDGMVCKTRDGKTYIWLNGALRCIDKWCSGTMDNLCNEDVPSCDIVEVYKSRATCIEKMFNVQMYGILIWRREEPKEMTMEEIEKTLGYPVKIVKEKSDAN